MKRSIYIALLPAVVFLATWEILAARDKQVAFFFASPSSVVWALYNHTANGTLASDFVYSAVPAVAGFLVSVLIGTILGLCLAIDSRRSGSFRAYVGILANTPVFAIAPMMIVWFGIDLKMKFALAIFSTIFIATSQAYDGAMTISPRDRRAFENLGAGRWMIVRKLLLPSSIDWIISGMKVTAGLALLGTFLGEFMASEQGLGHRMLKAGSIYDVALVLACAVWMIVLVLLLNGLAVLTNRWRGWIIEKLSVHRAIWT